MIILNLHILENWNELEDSDLNVYIKDNLD